MKHNPEELVRIEAELANVVKTQKDWFKKLDALQKIAFTGKTSLSILATISYINMNEQEKSIIIGMLLGKLVEFEHKSINKIPQGIEIQ